MIDNVHKVIFIHIPKCAGETIRKLLGEKEQELYDDQRGIERRHATAQQIRDFYTNGEFDRYFKFAIVRNPYERMVSAYHYLNLRVGVIGPFEDYISQRGVYQLTEDSGKIERTLIAPISLYDYLYGSDGNILVDYIGRFESLRGELHHIFKELGLPTDRIGYTWKHRGHYDHYSQYYTNKIADEVYRQYEKDFDTFHYSKELR